MTQSPETGHCASMRMPSNNVMTPLRACQPQSGRETTNGVINWEQTGHQEECSHQQGQNLGGDQRSPYDQRPEHPEQNRTQPMLEQAGPFADHDRLDDLDAGRDDQQPAKKQHGDDGGRHGAHDRENPEQRQADAEDQEPAPVVDDLGRNSHIQSLDLGHGVSSPLAKGATFSVPGGKLTLLGTFSLARHSNASWSGRLPHPPALSAWSSALVTPRYKPVDTRRSSCRVLTRRCTRRFAAVAGTIAQRATAWRMLAFVYQVVG